MNAVSILKHVSPDTCSLFQNLIVAFVKFLDFTFLSFRSFFSEIQSQISVLTFAHLRPVLEASLRAPRDLTKHMSCKLRLRRSCKRTSFFPFRGLEFRKMTVALKCSQSLGLEILPMPARSDLYSP